MNAQSDKTKRLTPARKRILHLIKRSKVKVEKGRLAIELGWGEAHFSRILHGKGNMERFRIPPEVLLQLVKRLGVMESELDGTLEYEEYKKLENDTKILLRAMATKNETLALSRRKWIAHFQKHVEPKSRPDWEEILNGKQRVPYNPEFCRKLADVLESKEIDLFPQHIVNGIHPESQEADWLVVDRLVEAQARHALNEGYTAAEAEEWVQAEIRGVFPVGDLPNLPEETANSVVEIVERAMFESVKRLSNWAHRYAELRKVVRTTTKVSLSPVGIFEIVARLLPPADSRLRPLLKRIKNGADKPSGSLVEYYARKTGVKAEILAMLLLGLAEGRQYESDIKRVQAVYAPSDIQESLSEAAEVSDSAP